MKRLMLLFSIPLLWLCSGCTKEIVVAFPASAIVHVDPLNDSIIATCDSLVFFWPTYHPTPADDSSLYWFDLDGDGSLDLKVKAENYSQFYSTQNPQANYQAYIEFSSPDSSIEFAWYSNYPVLNLLDSMDVVHYLALPAWRNNGYAMFHHTNYPFGQTTTSVNYIAWRRKVGPSQYKYGWIRFKNIAAYPGFIYAITDWGWNNTVNQAIGAGEY